MEQLKNGIAKPFIKWAGGKSQLLDEIQKALPEDLYDKSFTYVEPFVGGGAVMFWVLKRYPRVKKIVINDINKRLINLYRTVKEQPSRLLAELQTLQDRYIPLNQDARTGMFFEKRSRFNAPSVGDIEQAALFIFLNRTCFNGLYRENSKGDFNVSHGKYTSPLICDRRTIIAASEALQNVEIMCGDFSETIKFAEPDALFYLDPPYKPLSKTSSFNSYVKESFDDSEQIRLRDFCQDISDKGSSLILSNSDCYEYGGGVKTTLRPSMTHSQYGE